jgi:hypothetical protein
MRILSAFIAGALLSGGLLASWRAYYDERPYCPTEDSCAVSYEHGTWKITEVTP